MINKSSNITSIKILKINNVYIFFIDKHKVIIYCEITFYMNILYSMSKNYL